MQSILIQPALAAVDVMQVAIMLVAVFFGIMRLLFEASKNSGKKSAALKAQQQPQPGPPQPLPAGGQQADSLRSQVEEFLRRAEQSQGAQPQAMPHQAPVNEMAAFGDLSQSPVRPSLNEANRPDTFTASAQSPPKSRPAKPDPKRAARRSVTPKRRVTLAERAVEREEIRVGRLADQASHLGSRIIEDDKHFDEQLKAKFDHTVGTFAGVPSTAEQSTSQPADSPARQIAAMLANPAGVQQAVIINEILRRPSDRW